MIIPKERKMMNEAQNTVKDIALRMLKKTRDDIEFVDCCAQFLEKSVGINCKSICFSLKKINEFIKALENQNIPEEKCLNTVS